MRAELKLIYKTWRMNEHGVRDITVRHDRHALSTFFQHAIKQHWTRDNPIRRVEIPSDADAVRMHVLTAYEEKQYFGLASKHRDLYDLGRLMLNQGMRPEEALALRKLARESGSVPATNPLRKIGGRAANLGPDA